MQYVLEVIIDHTEGQPYPTTEQLEEAARAAARPLPGTTSKWKIHGIMPSNISDEERKEKSKELHNLVKSIFRD